MLGREHVGFLRLDGTGVEVVLWVGIALPKQIKVERMMRENCMLSAQLETRGFQK